MNDLTGWKAPRFPPRAVREGRYCRLEPLDVARHGADIAAAFAGAHDVWTYLPLAEPRDRATYETVLRGMVERADIVPFAVIDRADNKAKGHLWLMEIRPEHGVFEVGFITFSPAMQRTRIATEAVYLCGVYGFELGYRRFEWKCHYRNAPSRRAAARFGFTFEGIFRQHMVVKGGNRDTVWFSILDSEWPTRKIAFERWLAPDNFDASGRQKISLSIFNQLRATEGGIELRRASLRDKPAIESLAQAAFARAGDATKSLAGMVTADLDAILRNDEVWLIEGAEQLDAALILKLGTKIELYISAVAPWAQAHGFGETLLNFAETRARALHFPALTLLSNVELQRHIAWFERRGYQLCDIKDERDPRLLLLSKSVA